MSIKTCSKCNLEKNITEFHKEKCGKDGFRSDCKSCRKEYKKHYMKKYYLENMELCKLKCEKYRKENMVRDRPKRALHSVKKRKSNTIFRLKSNLRSRTCGKYIKNGFSKNSTTEKLLGAEYEFVKKYIESKFKKGMNWNNYGIGENKWNIDHIIPLHSAKTKYDLDELCHYTNLQPLWQVENRLKSYKIIPTQIKIKI